MKGVAEHFQLPGLGFGKCYGYIFTKSGSPIEELVLPVQQKMKLNMYSFAACSKLGLASCLIVQEPVRQRKWKQGAK